jgi:ribonuclease BN (tRNA processing enzyme)
MVKLIVSDPPAWSQRKSGARPGGLAWESNTGCFSTAVFSPRGRLEDRGSGRKGIEDVFIMPSQPDHAAGPPLFLMELCLRGRRAPIRIHSGAETIRRIRKIMQMFGWRKMPDHFPIRHHAVKRGKSKTILENSEFRILSTPVRHVVPTHGVRGEVFPAHTRFVYSADTESSADLPAMARG